MRVDPVTLEPRFRIIGCDLWSDDPGFADASAGLGVTEIVAIAQAETVVKRKATTTMSGTKLKVLLSRSVAFLTLAWPRSMRGS